MHSRFEMRERGQFGRLRAGARAGTFTDRGSQAAFATIQLRKSCLSGGTPQLAMARLRLRLAHREWVIPPPSQLKHIETSGQTETGADAPASGTVSRNVAPPSGLFVASIVPPCAAAILCDSASPMPIPSAFVVVNG